MLKIRALVGLLALSTIVSNPVNAIGINTMVNVVNSKDGEFTIYNNDGYRQYISVAISDVSVIDGELITKNYNRENIEDWTLEVKPTRSVIDDQSQKKFRVIHKPKNESKYNDAIYQLTFVPTPYLTGDERPENLMQIAVGFAPLVIFPAENDSPLKYLIKRNEKTITIENKGKGYINTFVNGCSEDVVTAEERAKCSQVLYVLSGRVLTVDLPEEIQGSNSIKIEMSTNNGDYKDNFVLFSNQQLEK